MFSRATELKETVTGKCLEGDPQMTYSTKCFQRWTLNTFEFDSFEMNMSLSREGGSNVSKEGCSTSSGKKLDHLCKFDTFENCLLHWLCSCLALVLHLRSASYATLKYELLLCCLTFCTARSGIILCYCFQAG